jgi:hypothetical protein
LGLSDKFSLMTKKSPTQAQTCTFTNASAQLYSQFHPSENQQWLA